MQSMLSSISNILPSPTGWSKSVHGPRVTSGSPLESGQPRFRRSGNLDGLKLPCQHPPRRLGTVLQQGAGATAGEERPDAASSSV